MCLKQGLESCQKHLQTQRTIQGCILLSRGGMGTPGCVNKRAGGKRVCSWFRSEHAEDSTDSVVHWFGDVHSRPLVSDSHDLVWHGCTIYQPKSGHGVPCKKNCLMKEKVLRNTQLRNVHEMGDIKRKSRDNSAAHFPMAANARTDEFYE